MTLIIVSDVFGNTPALQILGDTLAEIIHSAVNIIDPYESKMMNFANEQEAYDYFTQHVGLAVYTEKLQTVINLGTEQKSLLGFSIGASAIWKLSPNSIQNKNEHSRDGKLMVQGAIGFYGSQIRNLTDIEPSFPIALIFPQSEQHFCVNDLMAKLTDKKQLTLSQVNHLHGFMNALSKNYNHKAYMYYCDWLGNKINHINTTH
jgi:dienelactone hydrolase